jgi:hypothetical protein
MQDFCARRKWGCDREKGNASASTLRSEQLISCFLLPNGLLHALALPPLALALFFALS